MSLDVKPSLTQDATLDRLLEELGEECRTTLNLLKKLRQPLSEGDRTEVLAELAAATIHLHAHCDEALQEEIWEVCDRLPDSEPTEE
ncbi:hypothetical protein AY599_21805 [Leptolyngbya valderiana BDU 20041]|nr:hypothetical protein [Geitlerinema sp. CS-897]OAB63658.1 hypothetical protein AY599_21805 [Leptolyngbya valderiana BDU 20041]PPT08797.1 hypothetical protein CKA32_005792 [Geitlerinema sp. FC II]